MLIRLGHQYLRKAKWLHPTTVLRAAPLLLVQPLRYSHGKSVGRSVPRPVAILRRDTPGMEFPFQQRLKQFREIDELIQECRAKSKGFLARHTVPILVQIQRLQQNDPRTKFGLLPEVESLVREILTEERLQDKLVACLALDTMHKIQLTDNDSAITQTALRTLRSNMEALSARDLSFFYNAVSQLQLADSAHIFKEISEACVKKADEFSSTDLTFLLKAAAVSRYRHQVFLDTFAEVVINKIDELPMHSLPSLLWSFSALQLLHLRLYDSLCSRVRTCLQSGKTYLGSDLYLIIWSMANMQYHDGPTLQQLMAGLNQVCRHSTPHQLASLIWSLARLRLSKHNLFRKTRLLLLGCASELDPVDSAHAIWALSQAPAYEQEPVHELARTVCANESVLSDRVLLVALDGLSDLTYYDIEFVMAVVERLREKVGTEDLYSPRDLVTILVSLARLTHTDMDLVSKIMERLNGKLDTLPIQKICVFAWACAWFGWYDSTTWRQLTAAIKLHPFRSLHGFHLILFGFVIRDPMVLPYFEADEIMEVRDRASKALSDHPLRERNFSFSEFYQLLLQSAKVYANMNVVVDSFADFMVTVNGKAVAVNFLSPRQLLCHPHSQPRALELQRTSLLQKQGYPVLEVNEAHEWLGCTNHEKATLVRKVLAKVVAVAKESGQQHQPLQQDQQQPLEQDQQQPFEQDQPQPLQQDQEQSPQNQP